MLYGLAVSRIRSPSLFISLFISLSPLFGALSSLLSNMFSFVLSLSLSSFSVLVCLFSRPSSLVSLLCSLVSRLYSMILSPFSLRSLLSHPSLSRFPLLCHTTFYLVLSSILSLSVPCLHWRDYVYPRSSPSAIPYLLSIYCIASLPLSLSLSIISIFPALLSYLLSLPLSVSLCSHLHTWEVGKSEGR